MKYTTEIVDHITQTYKNAPNPETVAALAKQYDVSDRSIIAKLSSLGVYQKKTYVNKRGELPVKKEIYIERIAALLELDASLLESLEKVTKTALVLIEKRIQGIRFSAA